MLFRGVAASEPSLRRRSLITGSVRGLELFVDGHNQAFTIMHYLDGRPLFLGSDGLLRDAGASHGHIADRDAFRRALDLLSEAIAAAAPARVRAYFDAPITGSESHAAHFADELHDRGLEAIAAVEKSADAPLKRAGARTAVATGDSAIVEALAHGFSDCTFFDRPLVFDAARFAIELAFAPTAGRLPWLDLAALLDGSNKS